MRNNTVSVWIINGSVVESAINVSGMTFSQVLDMYDPFGWGPDAYESCNNENEAA